MKRSRIMFAAVVASSAVFAAAPMLIPAPREMSVTGGRVALAAADAPNVEVAWSNPDPAKRDFAEFSARAAEHRRRLIRDHVNCAPLK